MDKILNQIEQDFASQITSAQEAVNLAQVELNNLVATVEEKKKAVTEYYTALADKERAETVIARTDVAIKSEVTRLTITK